MQITAATSPGEHGKPNEDWFLAAPDLIVVLDGATARTGTGCHHGTAWYAATLGMSIAERAVDAAASLKDALRQAIAATAARHPECDLTHPGTPSAAVAVVRHRGETLEYLVLGDVTVVLETADGVTAICDDGVDQTAIEEWRAAALHPFDTAEKQAALLVMKYSELALRNREGGYWISAASPTAADHSLTGKMPRATIDRYAILTDGAARLAAEFKLVDWRGLLDLLETHGPNGFISKVREAEAGDSSGALWPRNKRSDDATVIFAQPS